MVPVLEIIILIAVVFLAIKFGKPAYKEYREKRKRQKAANVIKPVVTPTEPVAPETVAVAPVIPAPTPEPVKPVVTRQDVSGHDVPFDINKVKWLHTNASKWKETAVLSKVSISENRTTFKHSKGGVWPPYNFGADSNGNDLLVDSNLWIFAEIKGAWYGATFEYLRPKQVRKEIGYRLIGGHTKQNPIASFPFHSGDKVYVMASGLARDSRYKTVKERSNIVPVVLK